MNKTQLIETHLEFAQTLAKKKKRSVGSKVSYEELESAAYHGLVEAANNYNETIPFKNYAGIRIMGEMNDYMRELRWGGKADIKVITLEVDIPKETKEKPDLSAVLADLPQTKRQVLLWYYWEGLSMQKIAQKLELTKSMVSKMIKRFKQQLCKRKDEILSKI